jgi:hypothetical protein
LSELCFSLTYFRFADIHVVLPDFKIN